MIQSRPLGPAIIAGIGFVAFAGGCREFAHHRAGLETYAASGQYAAAAAVMDEPETIKQYGSRNEVLWKLDRGTLAMYLGDTPTSLRLLNEAESTIEVQREASASDVLAQWIANDASTKYIAEPYEDIYLNVIKCLAQLQAGNIQGGATVEARRMAGKVDMLRDRYLKYEEALSEKSTSLPGSARGLVSTADAGRFIESTLGTFLTAVVFMKTGESNFQGVAARRLQESIRIQQGLIGPVRGEDFADLESLRSEEVNVLAVALSGRGPTKFAERVGPIPLGTIPVYFELPQLRTYPSEVAGARLEIESDASESPAAVRLNLVEDLSSVAAENHRRMLPLIYTRTLIRYAAKAGISVALTEAARKGARDSDQGWVQLAGVLAGLVVIGATEEADLRSWIFLPGQAHVGLGRLAPGPHRVRVVYESFAGGQVYATEWRAIDVTESGLVSVVARYWR